MSHNKRTPTASQLRGAAMAATFVVLYGCAGQQPNPQPLPVVAPEQTVNIDPTLMTYCPAVAHIPRQKYSQGQTLDPVKYWQNLYTQCAGKQRKLVDLAADAFKLPQPKPPVTEPYPVIKQ